jgi:arabinogalactan endo-1,4-beta-galactosidase
MQQYAELTQVGYDAVKAVYPDAQVIVHLDAGPTKTLRLHLRWSAEIWHQVGHNRLSVYPYWTEAGLEKDWQGTVRSFTANIKHLVQKYGTETMVVETGVEARKPEAGKRILKAIIDAARNQTDGHCHGVFYWAPELEGPYPLGAFIDQRPTVIMDAFKEAAQR